jgi:DNA-binding beta-propeller fold protein YncE
VSQAVAVFDRDLLTGTVLQKVGTAACISEFGGVCTDGRGLAGRMAISPDGRNIYTTLTSQDTIAVLNRDPVTGVLTQDPGPDGCISEVGDGVVCADGKALDMSLEVIVSPDGNNVYTASAVIGNAAIAVFDRIGSGALKQKTGTAACLSETGSAGECLTGKFLAGSGLVISPDGKSVFRPQGSTDTVAILDRGESGELSQSSDAAGCISETGSSGMCTNVRSLDGPVAAGVSPDGENVYITAILSESIAIFTRRPAVYDVDGDSQIDALTDMLLLLRYAFGFRGGTLINGAVDLINCTRCTAPDIEAFIASLSD